MLVQPRQNGAAPTPYIPVTEADRDHMLARLGVATVDDLFDQLPGSFRDPHIELPQALSEAELIRALGLAAAKNAGGLVDRPSFLGAGAYRHTIPAVVGNLTSRSEFATSYTPYQPEISQGTLQAAFEFQSVVCELTGLDVANTGMYDGASAAAEACLLAARSTHRHAVALLEPVHPNLVDVVHAYAYGGDLRVDILNDAGDTSADHACLLAQQPDFLGTIRNVETLAAAAHRTGALAIVSADPFALGLLRAPGDAGADIVVGEGRDLAGPLNFGGPSLGLFAVRERFLRQMPGRLVGQTREIRDREGESPRTGYVLTLQAREQFIRRERATSNFSTGQALVALAFTIAVQSLGPHGMRTAAEHCYQRAHDAAARINAIPGYRVVDRGPWFQEFLVEGPLPPRQLFHSLGDLGIQGGFDVSGRPEAGAANATLFCVTEATPSEHIENLVSALAAIGEAAL